tara:strand:+ start:933 stop:1169 length:237 start_codon:yes stop_codon:yes gene_type:complete
MSKEHKQASDLQDAVRKREKEWLGDYDEDEVKQAVVHAREDIVLLVSHSANIIKILKSIRFILVAILVLFAIYLNFNL